MQSPDETTRQNVFSESVQIKVLTPPWKVYNHTNNTVTATLTTNGIFSGAKTNNCKTKHTTNKRTAAPNILEMKKNQAPVL